MINLQFQTTTGIYVGTKDVYVAQLKNTIFGPRLIKFGKTEIQAPFSPTQRAEASREQGQAIIQAVRRVVREQNIAAKKVFLALTGKDVLIRYFQIPRIPRQEWEAAIRFEAKKYIPFKMDELMWDFNVVVPRAKDVKMDVTFVAVKAEVAQWYMSLIAQAGLQVVAMEPAPFALLRLFAQGNQMDRTRPCAVVDVDCGMADINIVKKKICYLTRDVSLPLDDEIIFENLLNEIRMSLDYYEKLFPGDGISKVLLSGAVDLKDWDKILMEELKVPVEKIDLVKVVKIPKVLPPTSLGVAIGLSLRDISRVMPQINLCKVREVKPKAAPEAKAQPMKFTPEIQKTLKQALIVSGFLLLVAHLFMFYRISIEKTKLDEVVSMRPQVETHAVSLPYEDIEIEKTKLMQRINLLSQIVDKRIFWTQKLDAIPKLIPDGIWLTNIEITDQVKYGQQMVLVGIVYDQDPVREIGLITKFISNLKEDQEFFRGFKEINMGTTSSQFVSGVSVKDFTISCTQK